MDRRGFLKSILALGVAPAFIKSENLMKCTGIIMPDEELILPESLTGGNIIITSQLIARESIKILKDNLKFHISVNRAYLDELRYG